MSQQSLLSLSCYLTNVSCPPLRGICLSVWENGKLCMLNRSRVILSRFLSSIRDTRLCTASFWSCFIIIISISRLVCLVVLFSVSSLSPSLSPSGPWIFTNLSTQLIVCICLKSETWDYRQFALFIAVSKMYQACMLTLVYSCRKTLYSFLWLSLPHSLRVEACFLALLYSYLGPCARTVDREIVGRVGVSR